MTPIYRYPARQFKGSYTITGTLAVDASAYLIGPVELATSLDVDATMDVTGIAAFITSVDSCGNRL